MASIIIDNPDNQQQQNAPALTPGSELVSWVMSRVDRWRAARDAQFKDRWDEYYRLWRGRWSPVDKNRNSERSRLIAPALAQAIEMTVAEMEEATFGREQWFDVQDDDKQEEDALLARDNLLMDFYKAGVPDKVAEVYMNGALYGSGIGKIVVEPVEEVVAGPNGRPTKQPRVYVRLEPIAADEFIPDPSGRTIDEMLGCAHEVIKPKNYVLAQQANGTFDRNVVIGGMREQDSKSVSRADLEQPITADDAVVITEYHGLVPGRMLPTSKRTELDAALDADTKLKEGDGPLVEAIVTIGNAGTLLRAIPNPFLMRDRSIIAYQHDKVPGRFWGRGVAEKGYNPQKALDVEMRSRADALALISNPMLGADVTRMPKGLDLRVRPGKVWATVGNPNEILSPVVFAGLEPATFNQSGDLERMVQMGTGAMDTATPVKQNERNSTATGTSLMVGAFIKRSKRTMANVSRQFLEPLVQKAMWRYQQYETSRYPRDYQFRVIATSGIMAREFEQSQLTQLMGQIPDEMAQPKLLVLKAIIDQSSSTIKSEIKQAIDAATQVTPEQQQQQAELQKLAFEKAQLEVENLRMENQKLKTEAFLNVAKTKTEAAKADIADDQTTLQAADVRIDRERLDIEREQNDIKRAELIVRTREAEAKKEEAKNKPKGSNK